MKLTLTEGLTVLATLALGLAVAAWLVPPLP